MYKIYINDTPLILAGTDEIADKKAQNDRELVARYVGKPKFLFHYIDMLEKGKRFDAVTLYFDDVEQLFSDFASHYNIIEAAGGLVFNANQEMLLIFRRGTWDLPKGKIDKGETKEAAAVREVQEETGLQNLTLGDLRHTMYHTYREGRQRILKRTYWFEMHTTDADLTPQAEEQIEKAEWWQLEKFLASELPVYASIRALLVQISRQKF